MRLSPNFLLGGSLACAAAFAALLGIAYGWDRARMVDVDALQGFLGLNDTAIVHVAHVLFHFGSPPEVIGATAVFAAIAAARGRPRVAVFIVVLIGATSVGGQILKSLLAFPRPDLETGQELIRARAFPSGHANSSMSLAIALVLAMPNRLRPLAAGFGVLIALGVSFSMLIVGGHFPSDIVGGFLVAIGIGFALLALLRAVNDRYPERPGRAGLAVDLRRVVEGVAEVGLTAAVAIAALLIAVGVIVLGALRMDDVVSYAQEHTSFVIVAVMVSAAALTLLAALAAAVSRRG